MAIEVDTVESRVRLALGLSYLRRGKKGELLAKNPLLEQRVESVAQEVFGRERRLFSDEVLQTRFMRQIRRRVNEALGEKLLGFAQGERSTEIRDLIERVQIQFPDLPVTPERQQRFGEMLRVEFQDPTVEALVIRDWLSRDEVALIAQDLVDATRQLKSCCVVQ